MASFRPTTSGVHRFKLRTNASATLFVDDTEVGDDGSVALDEGRDVALRVACRSDGPGLRVSVELRCASPDVPDVGLDGEWETEGRDRENLSLPGDQVELIRAVAAAQPRTAVVVVAGSPVDLSWTDEVPAVLWCWYPGQEGGHGIADVLLGDADPGGRLPCTMPRRIEDTPAFLDVPPEPGVLRYQGGVFCGHRWYDARLVEPAFPFGHGLSYTRFSIGAPDAGTDTIDPGDTVEVGVDVTNTGERRGSEVIQLFGLFAIHVGRSSRDLPGIAELQLTADWTSPP